MPVLGKRLLRESFLLPRTGFITTPVFKSINKKMALEKYRAKSLYDKLNNPVTNEELKEEITKVKKGKVEAKTKKHGK